MISREKYRYGLHENNREEKEGQRGREYLSHAFLEESREAA